MRFSFLNRDKDIEKLKNSEFDLLIIGGGITGAGIALDAQCRGLKTALVEMQDFASGTSSRSTKLIHGGLRYLKQMEFGLVAEVGRERTIVHRNAPHITNPETMLLPIIRGGSMGKIAVKIGMWIYETLARVKKEEWHTMLGTAQTLEAEPLLDPEKVTGGVLFYEYRTDDARLTIEVLKEAADKGAVLINYSKVTDFIYKENKVCGVKIHDELSGSAYEILAKKTVNATGPWTDQVCDYDSRSHSEKLHITKGIHIVVDRKKLPLTQSVYFDVPDKRMIFAIPRQGKVYIGTTDNFYSGSLEHPEITEADRTYLINAVNNMFPSSALSVQDVESAWAGLRPLVHKAGKSPSEISRKDEIFLSESGLVTIAGGKLTGYRKMAERTVHLVTKQLKQENNLSFKKCSTDRIQVSGGKIKPGQFKSFMENSVNACLKLGLSTEESKELASRYGSNIDKLIKRIENRTQDVIHHGMPLFVYAQLRYCIEEEMIVKPGDFFIRRTGALFFDISWVNRWKEEVALYMQQYFRWSDQVREEACRELETNLSELLTNS